MDAIHTFPHHVHYLSCSFGYSLNWDIIMYPKKWDILQC